ncbi:MAG TPA: hypothetical protein VFH70_05290, partial [Acidimicrobiales bacterium]|nr:hypothetical protein [Acidimicrobiales bacterium]
RYHTIVVALGTNGAFSPSQFNQMASVLAGVPRVVVVNVHVAKTWAAGDDVVLAQGVAAHRNQMKLMDWNTAAGGPGLLYPDGIHPNGAGSALYARLLQQALSTPLG